MSTPQTTLWIVVPDTSTPHGHHFAKSLARASLIVATEVSRTDIRVDYEGDIYGHLKRRGLPPAETAVARLLRSADHHISQYPTVACATLPREAVVTAATWRFDENRVELTNADALTTWLAPLEVTAEQLAAAVAASEDADRFCTHMTAGHG